MFEFLDADCVRLYESCRVKTNVRSFVRQLGLSPNPSGPISFSDAELQKLKNLVNIKVNELTDIYKSEKELREAMNATFFWGVTQTILSKCGNNIWNESTEGDTGLIYSREEDRITITKSLFRWIIHRVWNANKKIQEIPSDSRHPPDETDQGAEPYFLQQCSQTFIRTGSGSNATANIDNGRYRSTRALTNLSPSPTSASVPQLPPSFRAPFAPMTPISNGGAGVNHQLEAVQEARQDVQHNFYQSPDASKRKRRRSMTGDEHEMGSNKSPRTKKIAAAIDCEDPSQLEGHKEQHANLNLESNPINPTVLSLAQVGDINNLAYTTGGLPTISQAMRTNWTSNETVDEVEAGVTDVEDCSPTAAQSSKELMEQSAPLVTPPAEATAAEIEPQEANSPKYPSPSVHTEENNSSIQIQAHPAYLQEKLMGIIHPEEYHKADPRGFLELFKRLPEKTLKGIWGAELGTKRQQIDAWVYSILKVYEFRSHTGFVGTRSEWAFQQEECPNIEQIRFWIKANSQWVSAFSGLEVQDLTKDLGRVLYDVTKLNRMAYSVKHFERAVEKFNEDILEWIPGHEESTSKT